MFEYRISTEQSVGDVIDRAQLRYFKGKSIGIVISDCKGSISCLA